MKDEDSINAVSSWPASNNSRRRSQRVRRLTNEYVTWKETISSKAQRSAKVRTSEVSPPSGTTRLKEKGVPPVQSPASVGVRWTDDVDKETEPSETDEDEAEILVDLFDQLMLSERPPVVNPGTDMDQKPAESCNGALLARVEFQTSSAVSVGPNDTKDKWTTSVLARIQKKNPGTNDTEGPWATPAAVLETIKRPLVKNSSGARSTVLSGLELLAEVATWSTIEACDRHLPVTRIGNSASSDPEDAEDIREARVALPSELDAVHVGRDVIIQTDATVQRPLWAQTCDAPGGYSDHYATDEDLTGNLYADVLTGVLCGHQRVFQEDALSFDYPDERFFQRPTVFQAYTGSERSEVFAPLLILAELASSRISCKGSNKTKYANCNMYCGIHRLNKVGVKSNSRCNKKARQNGIHRRPKGSRKDRKRRIFSYLRKEHSYCRPFGVRLAEVCRNCS